MTTHPHHQPEEREPLAHLEASLGDDPILAAARDSLHPLASASERDAAVKMLSVWGQEALAHERSDRAVACFRILVEHGTEADGADAHQTMVWRGYLGRALVDTGCHEEAEALLAELLIDRERLLGADHELTLITRGNLARAVALSGNHAEGILLARRLLDDRTRLLGPDHPSTLDSRGHLAHFALLAGDAAGAAAMYEALLADRERLLDSNDPVLDQTRYNLVVAQGRSLDDDAPLHVLETFVDRVEDLLGPDHVRTLDWLEFLALRQLGEDRLEDSLDTATELYERRSRVYGEQDLRTLSARQHSANSLYLLARLDAAEDILQDVVERYDTLGMANSEASITVRADLLAIQIERSMEEDPELDRPERFWWSQWKMLEEDSAHLDPDTRAREAVMDIAHWWD